jgi:uncharacterized membrane protein (DUF485 family)
MKILPKSLTIALSVAVGVYVVAGTYGYISLAAHQPPHKVGVPMPPDVTSFPPSAAWIFSISWFLAAFVLTFIIAFIALKICATKRHAIK